MNRISQEFSWKKAVLRGLPWIILVVLGLWLRIGSLDVRPLHADEGVQGMIAANLLESGEYAYNPRKFHGPSLYYMTLPVAWLRGQETRAELDVWTLRLVPMIFGLLICVAPVLFRRELGNLGLFVTTGFLLLSPGLVYYSTFYIQESLLLAGFALFSGCYWRYRYSPRMAWAVGMGLSIGLMATSKESFLLYLLVVLFAGWITIRVPVGGQGRTPMKDLAIILGSACVVIVPLFSSFGGNLHGLVDAVTGLYQYQPESGHGKPWYYYLSVLSGFSRGSLFLRGEGILLIGAVLGGIFASIFGKNRQFTRFHALVCALLIISFSLFGYKTPWLVMGVLFPMALLVGLAVRNLIADNSSPARRLVIFMVLIAAWGFTVREAIWTTQRFPVEKRNPYAYVHTSWDLEELTNRVLKVSSSMEDPVVKVISDEYWPIPWYLRSMDRVGYWTAMPEDPYAPIMIISAELAGSLDPERMQAYRYEFRGLRPGKIMLLYYLKGK